MDVSQRQLAAVLGVDEQTVSLWERGSHQIPQAAEIVLRTWVKEHDSNRPEIRDLTERMNTLDRELFELEKRLELKRSGSGWVKKAA
jgi:transcriptional regulator with XRE-family HTH domain